MDNILQTQQERRVDIFIEDTLLINKSFNDILKNDIFRIRNENNEKWYRAQTHMYTSDDGYGTLTVLEIGTPHDK